MNSYITLDGKRYGAIHQQWMPINRRPMSVRQLLSGNMDVVYGTAFTSGWEGVIRVPASESDPNGDIADLRTTIDKKETVTFVDHYGNSYTVVIQGDIPENSITPMWDASSNVFNIPITVLKVS